MSRAGPARSTTLGGAIARRLEALLLGALLLCAARSASALPLTLHIHGWTRFSDSLLVPQSFPAAAPLGGAAEERRPQRPETRRQPPGRAGPVETALPDEPFAWALLFDRAATPREPVAPDTTYAIPDPVDDEPRPDESPYDWVEPPAGLDRLGEAAQQALAVGLGNLYPAPGHLSAPPGRPRGIRWRILLPERPVPRFRLPDPAIPAPEPATLLLLASGLLIGAAASRLRLRR